MEKILLMGNPNVGKSSIFSRLTGTHVSISNYPGTTVEFTQGKMKLGSETPVVIDVPGVYSLDPVSKAEEIAVRMLEQGGVVVNVIDATNLERNLFLTLHLLAKDIPVLVALNMWDDTRHQGIHIDVEKLEKHLGVPVVPTCGLTGEGIKNLIERLPEAKVSALKTSSNDQKWETIGRIIGDVQQLAHRRHTVLEMLEDVSIRPFTGLIMAATVVYGAFQAVRFGGEYLAKYLFEPPFQKLWLPLMERFSASLGPDTFFHHILIGNLIGGRIDFVQSFGLLTTGFFVPIAMVLPYILVFYLTLGLLEDFGYLPRLAVLMDNLMHHLGLHGYAFIPIVLGLGCKVPGILAVRILEERREKFITATLLTIAVPCMTQVAMIVALVGQRGGRPVLIIFAVLLTLMILTGAILNRVLKEESSEMLIEIPPFRMPQIGTVLKKLWMRLYDALPLILVGVFFANVLYVLKVVDFLGAIFSPILTGLWGLPREAIPALLVGFLRKDVAVGMLAPLALTTKQLIISSVILTVYFPCVAAFAVLIRELGLKDSTKIISIVITVSILLGAFLNLVLI